MDKYDRQLRLWGPDGQRRLAQTHVLLLHASATGAETLKNLVLPGVQRITVLDDALVTLADVTNNFFVTHSALGRSRAQVVSELLLEMNADVQGDFRQADPLQLLQTEPQYLDQFQMVIATQTDDALLLLLGELCQDKAIPLLAVNSYGLLGSFRLQVAQHTIVDAKNDPPIHELRLSKPFPALEAYAAQFELAKLSTIEHAHVPFVVLLLKATDAWKASHDGQLPRTFPEKNEFKQLLKSMAWGGDGHEVNFLEALDHAYKAYVAPVVPDECQAVLQSARARQLSAQSADFWFLARGLVDFVDANDGVLPLTGVVPDMTASTETYVALQLVYVTKAKQDAAQVQCFVRQQLQALGLPPDRISTEQVETFCKNCYNLGVLNTRTIAEEHKAVELDAVDLEEENSTQSPLIWYFMLRAVSAFASEFKRFPGSLEAERAQDAAWLVITAKTLAGANATVAEWITDAHAQEMTRSCEVELHNVAALMGGVAAQEAVKIITHQFVPLNHTYLFNGIAGLAATYAL